MWLNFGRGVERWGERGGTGGGERGANEGKNEGANARGVNGEHAWGGEQGTWGEHVSLRMC